MEPRQSPALSVVVAIVSDTVGETDTVHLAPCLEALLRQENAPSMEILVPYGTGLRGIDRMRSIFPAVRFIEVAGVRSAVPQRRSREHHDILRARGLAESRGGIAALIEDHGVAAPGWAARMVEAHRGPAVAVGGAIENGVQRPLNWAVYFCDFLRYQNPLPNGEAATASDANVSYKRAALDAVRPVWREAFHESIVNHALFERGGRLALSPEAVVEQRRRGLRLAAALKERFVWGRSYGATRAAAAPTARRVFWAVFAPVLPALILARMSLMAWRKRRTFGPFLVALPLTAALTVSWSWGEFAGYLTGRPGSAGGTESQPCASE
jgi:hypothetical protein